MDEKYLELYTKLTCALTHNLSVCDTCKKCGEDAATIRLDLIRNLAPLMREKIDNVGS